jgi:ABC-type uncharacterized transport system auxiliary subunit
MKNAALFFLLPLLAFVSSCNLAPVDTGRADMFYLRQGHVSPPLNQPVAQSLTVGLPTAPDALDTYRIALRRDKGTWDYYAGTRWADFLTGMVQDTLVKSIEGAKIFKSTVTDESGLTGGMILKPEIRAFNAEYKTAGAPPVIHVRIVATFLTGVSRRTIATLSGAADRTAAADDLKAIQAAFQQAYLSVEQQLVTGLAAAVGTPPAELEKAGRLNKLEDGKAP